jgi:hypothetical protein
MWRGMNQQPLVPAKAGTRGHNGLTAKVALDSRLRGNERSKV